MQYYYLLLKSYIAEPIIAATPQQIAEACQGGSFFEFPRWYKYLPKTVTEVKGVDVCAPQLTSITDVWLIVLAVIEILLRVAVIVAIMFVVVGGVKFVTSRGNPDKISQARNTVQDALIGMIIAITASAVVGFIASRFTE